MSMRDTGKIVHWNTGGFGFIRTGRKDEHDIFFHISEVGDTEPRIGDRVSFVVGEDRVRRPCATEIQFDAETPPPPAE
jgi:cold shock CspA family protein